MTQAVWEKASSTALPTRSIVRSNTGRWKFLLGGALILGAVAYLILSNTLGGARYFITVEELLNNWQQYAGQSVRVTGAVIGDTIEYDTQNLLITFTVAHMPEQVDDLGVALNQAVNDLERSRMRVRVEDQVKPELLQNEAQAIMTGTLGEDGIFHVTELNLKCPSRFIEGAPNAAITGDTVDGEHIQSMSGEIPADHPVLQSGS